MDKNGTGIGSRKDTYRLMKKYNRVVNAGVNVMKLIRRCDKNNDNVLEVSEIHELLKVESPIPPPQLHDTAAHPALPADRRAAQMACGKPATRQDAEWVVRRLESMARASTHGGYDSRMTSDPLIVSKALFEWWWVERGNRGEFYRRIQAGRRGEAAGSEDARRAAEVLQVEVGALDMDNIRFEDLMAHHDSALTVDLVSPGRACSPGPVAAARPTGPGPGVLESVAARGWGIKGRRRGGFRAAILEGAALRGSDFWVCCSQRRGLTRRRRRRQGLQLLRKVGERVHKAAADACSPLGQAFVGCVAR